MQTYDKLGQVARKLDNADIMICASFNKFSRSVSVRALFRTISRLGDGVLWYCMMALLPIIGGYEGLVIALHMGVTALLGLVIYKVTKTVSERERPYINHSDRVACEMPPLDRYSFPSGHTLHAVCFTIVLCSYFPELIWLLLPFTLLIALSRMILGLHYPSDVLVGAAIGAMLALGSFELLELLGHPLR